MTTRKECSIFVDETGSEGGRSRYYALTLVFHEQADDIEAVVAKYEAALRERGLDNLPFHASPLSLLQNLINSIAIDFGILYSV